MNFKTLDLAIQFNHHIQHIKVTGHLRDQLHRAASSIALKLADYLGASIYKLIHSNLSSFE